MPGLSLPVHQSVTTRPAPWRGHECASAEGLLLATHILGPECPRGSHAHSLINVGFFHPLPPRVRSPGLQGGEEGGGPGKCRLMPLPLPPWAAGGLGVEPLGRLAGHLPG